MTKQLVTIFTILALSVTSAYAQQAPSPAPTPVKITLPPSTTTGWPAGPIPVPPGTTGDGGFHKHQNGSGGSINVNPGYKDGKLHPVVTGGKVHTSF